MTLRPFVFLLATGLTVLTGGCATTSTTTPSTTPHHIPPTQHQPTTVDTSVPVSVVVVPPRDNSAPVPQFTPLPGEAVVEDLDSTDQPLSTRDALDRAIEWASEGLKKYKEGDHAGARNLLRNARAVLLEADLPEVMQEQGLSALSFALKDDLGGHDLETIVRLLEVEADTAADASVLAERDYIEREVRRLLLRFGADSPQEAYLTTFVNQVELFIDYYRGQQREFFERSYGRKHKYWPIIEEIFESKNIPAELGYMALVESGFNPRARSHANARGLWQFIPGTGKRYQLRQVDDFYDVRKATEAASEYLLDLIGIFGSPSFLLATAAYNAGEGRIQGCLRKLDDPFLKRSFWEIRSCLARETQEYVPRIMAAVVIGSDPTRFGFDLPTAQEIQQNYDIVTVPTVTRLSEVARQSGVSVADLRTANSDLASTATSTPVRNFPLYIPKGGGQRLAHSLAADPQAGASWPQAAELAAENSSTSSARPLEQRQRSSPPPTPRATVTTPQGTSVEYVARRGDTLAEIAQAHGVTVSNLRSWNPFLRRRVLYRGDRLHIDSQTQTAAVSSTYRVRRGDNLSKIAQRHGVSWQAIAAANNLRSPYSLQVGQRLTIRSGGGQASRPQLVYTVKKGNSLQAIAGIFSVRYRDIMAWNNLNTSRLRTGQKLKIQPPRPTHTENYRVSRGDTVAKIARRFGVAVRDILTANGLGSRTLIRPGQRLVVYIAG
jgi:membrane-bound lytic murein transglycosylase D